MNDNVIIFALFILASCVAAGGIVALGELLSGRRERNDR